MGAGGAEEARRSDHGACAWRRCGERRKRRSRAIRRAGFRSEGVLGIMSSVAVYSYTHSVTYVADNILKSFKDIIRLSGLDPGKLVESWAVLIRGITAWLASGHLERVVL